MQLLHFIIKDLKVIIYDRKTLALLILMPIVIMTILGFSLKGMWGDDGVGIEVVNIGIIKEYNAEEEIQAYYEDAQNNNMLPSDGLDIESLNQDKILFNQVLNSEEVKAFIHYDIYELDSAKEALENESIIAYIILPEGFVYDGLIDLVSVGRNEIQIQIITHPDHSFMGQIITQFFENYSANMNLQKAKSDVLLADLIANGKLGNVEAIMEGIDFGNDSKIQLSLTKENVNRTTAINSFQYYVVAIMSMFIMYFISIGGRTILNEKREHTYQRQMVMGIKPLYIFISNFIRVFFLTILQSVIMIGYSIVVLQVAWGSISNMIITLIVTSGVVAVFSLFITAITLVSNSGQVANIFQSIIIQFMALVGGSMIPIEILPKAMSDLSIVSISGQAIKMYLNGMNNMSLNGLLPYLKIYGIYSLVIICMTTIIMLAGRKRVVSC